jgi:hypothetical protein
LHTRIVLTGVGGNRPSVVLRLILFILALFVSYSYMLWVSVTLCFLWVERDVMGGFYIGDDDDLTEEKKVKGSVKSRVENGKKKRSKHRESLLQKRKKWERKRKKWEEERKAV